MKLHFIFTCTCFCSTLYYSFGLYFFSLELSLCALLKIFSSWMKKIVGQTLFLLLVDKKTHMWSKDNAFGCTYGFLHLILESFSFTNLLEKKLAFLLLNFRGFVFILKTIHSFFPIASDLEWLKVSGHLITQAPYICFR